MKYEEHRARLLPDLDMASLNTVSRRPSLLNFKSLDIAEQMTLLGNYIFNEAFALMKLVLDVGYKWHFFVQFK